MVINTLTDQNDFLLSFKLPTILLYFNFNFKFLENPRKLALIVTHKCSDYRFASNGFEVLELGVVIFLEILAFEHTDTFLILASNDSE